MIPKRLFALGILLTLILHTPALAQAPSGVTLIGSIQPALGCDGEQQLDCPATQLTFDETHQLWIAILDLPAGDYQYRAAVNGSLDEIYGLNAQPDGDPITLSLDSDMSVIFFFDHNSRWLADNVNHPLANIPGNFNSEIGCPGTPLDDPANDGDWAPDCLQTLLQDPDGDGVYTFSNATLPAGEYECKVTINMSWAENYGDEGAPGGANIGFTVPKDGAEVVFSWDSETKVLTVDAAGAPKGNLREAKAHWVSADTILTRLDPQDSVFRLHFSADSSLEIGENGLTGGDSFLLTVDPAGPGDDILAKFPHLSNSAVLKLPASTIDQVADILRGQFALEATGEDGIPIEATGLQIPGVLDQLYTYDGPLGVTWEGDIPTLRLWAPTAVSVSAEIIINNTPNLIAMERDDYGVWNVIGEPDWNNQAYRYHVTVYAPSVGEIVTNQVTDPYSVGLTINSQYSLIIDLHSASLKPDGWEQTIIPTPAAPEDIVLYELHVRDFSAYDQTVPPEQRGTFMAFTQSDSNGMKHLRQLADAGLSHIHLLPVFDIATINENKAEWEVPLLDLTTFDSDSQRQQMAISILANKDGYNWGYDPFHYTTPEGSYSVEPDGTRRIIEFRSMVQSLAEADLGVVMDVVYNHTNASGQDQKSILDRIVPGYYHRLNSKGKVENSSCCQNTATEHNMMRKLMIDSVVAWAVEYKVNGFRFDLMGHHMRDDMLTLHEALDALTLKEHGIDGASIFVYGEGWNFGEVADDARGINATQLNMSGSGIGTFNDRLRDAVRGGNPFGGEQEQGFITGLYYDPNETSQGNSDQQRDTLLMFADQIRVGLAGNMADYEFISADGTVVRGNQVDYNGSPTGYTADPQEQIVYVSAHDNETLFDAIQYKVPLKTGMAERVRVQNLGLDLVMLSQGIPFFHAGSDMLRSKSMDRDSYDSGDWFNRLDFTYTTNNWGVGLPPEGKNGSKWRMIKPLLGDPDLTPKLEDIRANVEHFREMLKVRSSSALFRLQTGEQIRALLKFHNTGKDQIPGLIVMSIDDRELELVDDDYAAAVVLLNATNEEQSFYVADFDSAEMELHPVQKDSADPIVSGASFDDGTFTVPARTSAVFVLESEGAAGISPIVPLLIVAALIAIVLFVGGKYFRPNTTL